MHWAVLQDFIAKRRGTVSEFAGNITADVSARGIIPSDAPIAGAGRRIYQTAANSLGDLPGGNIAIMLFIVVFFMLALQPVGTGGESRLYMLFLAITGRASVAGSGGGNAGVENLTNQYRNALAMEGLAVDV